MKYLKFMALAIGCMGLNACITIPSQISASQALSHKLEAPGPISPILRRQIDNLNLPDFPNSVERISIERQEQKSTRTSSGHSWVHSFTRKSTIALTEHSKSLVTRRLNSPAIQYANGTTYPSTTKQVQLTLYGGLIDLLIETKITATSTYLTGARVLDITHWKGTLLPEKIGNRLSYRVIKEIRMGLKPPTTITENWHHEIIQKLQSPCAAGLSGPVFLIKSVFKTDKKGKEGVEEEGLSHVFYVPELKLFLTDCTGKFNFKEHNKIYNGVTYFDNLTLTSKASISLDKKLLAKEKMRKRALIQAAVHQAIAKARRPGNSAKARPIFESAFNLYKEGELKIASRKFKEGLNHAPSDANAHFFLAEIMAQLGKIKEAYLHYKVVLTLAPNSGSAAKAKARLQALKF